MVRVRFKVRFRVQKNSGLGLWRHSVNGIWDIYRSRGLENRKIQLKVLGDYKYSKQTPNVLFFSWHSTMYLCSIANIRKYSKYVRRYSTFNIQIFECIEYWIFEYRIFEYIRLDRARKIMKKGRTLVLHAQTLFRTLCAPLRTWRLKQPRAEVEAIVHRG